MKPGLLFLCMCMLAACEIGPSQPQQTFVDTIHVNAPSIPAKDSGAEPLPVDHAVTQIRDTIVPVNTGKTSPEELMRFAETLIGKPYVWASSDPKVGFDCSGFITYVFNHFNISVPRSSVDFTDVGKTIPVENARRGDFILFTGTDPLEKNIGHMGLVVSNNAAGLQFIHSTSGKAMGVTITPLNDQYRQRFVRVSRIF